MFRRPGVLGLLLPAVLLLATMFVTACGNPEQRDPVGQVEQNSAPVPAGPHLYCITNVGHTLVAYSLAERRVLPETARFLDPDPVGPWFQGTAGYYISRVESSGAGANALIRFAPKTNVETGRLKFPANSNPNSLLLFPDLPGVAWVALRGSTFDNFNINGVSVVDLGTLQDSAYCALNDDGSSTNCAPLAPGLGGNLTSLLGFTWDAAGCGGTGCAYAVVNNFDGTVRDGWLLVLGRDGQGRPFFLDAIPLGRNPRLSLVTDGEGELWAVNNGGFVHFGSEGQAGTLQVLDPSLFATGTAGDGTLAVLPIEAGANCAAPPSPDPGCDPTGLYSPDGLSGWLTTYPDDVPRTVTLSPNPNTLDAVDWSLPRITGPFFPAVGPPAGWFAALGGLGQARLGEVDPATSALLSDQNLQAGLGPLSCTEYDTP